MTFIPDFLSFFSSSKDNKSIILVTRSRSKHTLGNLICSQKEEEEENKSFQSRNWKHTVNETMNMMIKIDPKISISLCFSTHSFRAMIPRFPDHSRVACYFFRVSPANRPVLEEPPDAPAAGGCDSPDSVALFPPAATPPASSSSSLA